MQQFHLSAGCRHIGDWPQGLRLDFGNPCARFPPPVSLAEQLVGLKSARQRCLALGQRYAWIVCPCQVHSRQQVPLAAHFMLGSR